MTNTKPTYEEEIIKNLWSQYFEKMCLTPVKDFEDKHWMHIEGLKEEFDEIFINTLQKVHDEAYERGYEDGLTRKGAEYVKKNFGGVIKKLSKED